ncbi:TerC family protein [Mannheimia haemolytica]
MFDWITNPEAWVALFTLTGLDLPIEQRQSARIIGLGLAMGTRILLLLSLAWMMRLVEPLFTIGNNPISGRDLILLIGGLFLIVKSAMELKESISAESHEEKSESIKKASFFMVLIQIAIFDIIFSLDSVITAVAMADDIPVMVIAIIIAVAVMMLAAKTIGDFVDNNPTIKNLALAFLILIGIVLVGEGFDIHIPKAAVYTAMGFSVVVEMLNIKMRRNQAKLEQA